MARYDDLRPDEERWVDPNEVHVTRIDVPFLELTWFFIKASLAMALAFSVTSWLWVMIGTGIGSLLAGILFLLGVPGLLLSGRPAVEIGPAQVAAPAPIAAPAPAPPPEPPPLAAPAPAEGVVEPAPAPAPAAPAVDPDQAATEAAQRAELDRIRRERQR